MTLRSSFPGAAAVAIPTPVVNLAAAGTTQSGAYAIPVGQDCSVFNTVASGSGARLPAAGVSPGETYEVVNHGANALLLYPATGGQIGTLGTNTGYSVTAGKFAVFRCLGAGQWASCP